MNKIIDYLKKSNKKIHDNFIGEFFVMEKQVLIKDRVSKEIDVLKCFEYVLEKMPKFFYSNVEKFVIGDFDYLNDREIDATFSKKIVFITNKQETEDELISDIVHEIAHSFEEIQSLFLYSDKQIENEFLQKRTALFKVLETENLIPDFISREDFYRIDFQESFDKMLYKFIGYKNLTFLSSEIFLSPYGATSLREYFANAFEYFFIRDIFAVKKCCPSIYTKMINFLEF